MYSIQALWTAAHSQTAADGGDLETMAAYRIISSGYWRSTQRRTITSAWISSIPRVDFVALAKSLGMEAVRITGPGDLKAAFKIGVSRGSARS